MKKRRAKIPMCGKCGTHYHFQPCTSGIQIGTKLGKVPRHSFSCASCGLSHYHFQNQDCGKVKESA